MTAPVSTTAVKNQGPAAKTENRSKGRRRRGRAKDTARGILELQRVAGNRAVNQLIQPGSGLPLAPNVRSFMEERFNYDFSRVRIHTDQRAAAFSRSLGAQAYTVGHDIVFGAGQYDPTTVTGRALLAHELAHVVQAHGQIPSQFKIAPAADATEIQAERAAVAIAQSGHAQISGGGTPAIRLRRDPRLGEVLEQIEATPLVLRDDEETLRWIWERVRTVDYSDADNILPITEAVSNKFPHLVARFSALVERAIEYDRAQHERTMRLMQVQRRGPYGQYGPGVVLPVLANLAASSLLDLFEAIGNLFRSAGAFVRGLCEGFSESVSEDQARQLSVRLLQSAILNIIFPPVFLSGAVVGIVEDVVDTVRGIRDLIVNFREMASAAVELITVFFSSEGPRVARQFGHEIGKSFADRITGMLGGNIFRFTYELGKFIGPTIIYTILSFLGVPELLAASIVTRLMNILRPLLQRFPRLLRILEGIARRLPGRHRDSGIRQLGDGSTEPSAGSGTGATRQATSPSTGGSQPRQVYAGGQMQTVSGPTEVIQRPPGARSRPSAPSEVSASPRRATRHDTASRDTRSSGFTDEEIAEDIAEQTGRQDVPTEARAADSTHEILSFDQFRARYRDRLVDIQRHHSFFRYLLGAISRSRGTPGIPRHHRLVDIPTPQHEALHELFDLTHPQLARGEGAAQRISEMIRRGETTPSEIADRLEDFYRNVNHQSPDLLPNEMLDQMMRIISGIRRRGNI